MIKKDILNFIFYHNQTCLQKINNDNIQIFINKYQRILKENYQNKYSIEYIKTCLQKLKESKYIDSFTYDQINEIENDMDNSFFNNVISITLSENVKNEFIDEAKLYGFILNSDKFDSDIINSIEISTCENNVQNNKNEIDIADFNIDIVKKYISLLNNNFYPSHSDQFNQYYMIDDKLNILNTTNIIDSLDNIVDMIISYIPKIQSIKQDEGPAEDILNLYLSLMLIIYCKMKSSLSINYNNRTIYLSVLKNIGKINDILNNLSISEFSVKTIALLRTKRTLTIMADNVKGGHQNGV